MLLYFVIEGVPKAKQALTAASYLRGDAQQWIQPRLTDKLLRNNNPEGIFGSFRAFVNAIRNIYSLSND